MDLEWKEQASPYLGRGKAYMGTYPARFFEWNSHLNSAGLAKEQIVLTCYGSRRCQMEMMSAQEWLIGKFSRQMGCRKKQVVNILTRLHRSRPFDDLTKNFLAILWNLH